jgi:N-acetylmuramoyl-L-alanine amidase
LELIERSEVANALPNSLFVSIHFNDNTTASGDGVETFYAIQKAGLFSIFSMVEEPSPLFAQCVQTALVTGLGVTDRGTKPRQLAVVRHTLGPAVLVEGGFINNPVEARKLALPEYREQIAIAVADGISDFQKRRATPAPDSSLTTVANTR